MGVKNYLVLLSISFAAGCYSQEPIPSVHVLDSGLVEFRLPNNDYDQLYLMSNAVSENGFRSIQMENRDSVFVAQVINPDRKILYYFIGDSTSFTDPLNPGETVFLDEIEYSVVSPKR